MQFHVCSYSWTLCLPPVAAVPARPPTDRLERWPLQHGVCSWRCQVQCDADAPMVGGYVERVPHVALYGPVCRFGVDGDVVVDLVALVAEYVACSCEASGVVGAALCLRRCCVCGGGAQVGVRQCCVGKVASQCHHPAQVENHGPASPTYHPPRLEASF